MKIEIEGLQALATKLGITVEYLWEVLLRQAMISAMIDIAYVIFVALLCTLAYRYRKTIFKMWVENEFDVIALITIGTFVLFILIVVAIIAAFSVATPLINPEYWALDKILSSIKK